MKTPFGNTAAAIKLAEMVETNPGARRYVSSTLSKLSFLLREVLVIDDKSARRNLYYVIQIMFVDKVNKAHKLPPDVASLLRNVVVTRCRCFKRHADASTDRH